MTWTGSRSVSNASLPARDLSVTLLYDDDAKLDSAPHSALSPSDGERVDEVRVVANPGEHFVAGESRQPEIQQDEERKWIASPISVGGVSGEIFDGFLPVLDHFQWIGQARVSEGTL